MRPDVEELTMASPLQTKADRVDVAGVPVGGCRDCGIRASAVLVDAGDDAMVAVLEADIDGVDMRSRCQRAIQQIVALLRAEIVGIGCRYISEKAERVFGTLDQVLYTLHAGLAGLY